MDNMKVRYEAPPNFSAILKVFGLPCTRPGVLFTYGDTIYFPKGRGQIISNPILAHEAVHSDRQGVNPDWWWRDYLADKTFRLAEELLAHQVEYRIAAEGNGRVFRRRYLRAVAECLSGPLYGRLLSLASAKDQIKTGDDDEV